jgi:hypothetical protein
MLDRVREVWEGCLEKFLEMIFGRSCLELKSRLAAATHPSSESPATMVMRWGHDIYPLLPPLEPFLVPLNVVLVGVAQPQLVVVSKLPRTKAAPTASSTEACRVAMSSSSLVVFGHSRPSS